MLIAVCSLKGSPGVTTFSVALAARWPAPAHCVLLECDPAGGDLAARFALASSPGLLSLAAAARHDTDADLVWQHTQRLPGGLPAVAAPPGADQARAALTALAADHSRHPDLLREAANTPGTVLIVDCGRVDPGSPALPILRAADMMLLLARPHADDLAHLAARLPVVARWSTQPGLLLVGAGHSAAEVTRELGVPVMAVIPHDRPGAALLSGHPTRGRRPSRSPLGRAASRIAARLAGPLTPAPSPAPLTIADHPRPVMDAPQYLTAPTAPDRGTRNGRPLPKRSTT